MNIDVEIDWGVGLNMNIVVDIDIGWLQLVGSLKA